VAAVLGGCGGGDDSSQVRHTIREFVKATNARDSDKLCADILAKDFIEQATGATGSRARDVCRRQFKSLKGLDVQLNAIRKVKVTGDNATATTVLTTQGQRQSQLFRLHKEDGHWRMAGGAGG
jgi:ketosteroid isomerase-like protein